MNLPTGSFHRDASGRLCFEIHDIDSLDYPYYAKRTAKEFGLNPVGELMIGPDAMFQDYTDDISVIGIEWDVWSGLIVVAKNQQSEGLVARVADYLSRD